MPGAIAIAVVETPKFLSTIRRLVGDEERALLAEDRAASSQSGRTDLSQQDRNDFRRLTTLLV